MAVISLPGSTAIEIDWLDCLGEISCPGLEKIRTVDDLVNLIRRIGPREVEGYFADFTDYPGEYLKYVDNMFRFTYSDDALMSHFTLEGCRMIDEENG